MLGTAQDECQAGKFAFQEACYDCPIGFFSDSSQPVLIETGTSQTGCQICPAGYAAENPGADACTQQDCQVHSDVDPQDWLYPPSPYQRCGFTLQDCDSTEPRKTIPTYPCDYEIPACDAASGCLVGHCVCADSDGEADDCRNPPTQANEGRAAFNCRDVCADLGKSISFVSLPCSKPRNPAKMWAESVARECQIKSEEATDEASYVTRSECDPRGKGMCHRDFPYAFSPATNFTRCCSTEDAFQLGDKQNSNQQRHSRAEACLGKEISCSFPPCSDFPLANATADSQDLAFYHGISEYPNGSRLTIFSSSDGSCTGFICENSLETVVEGGCYSSSIFQPTCLNKTILPEDQTAHNDTMYVDETYIRIASCDTDGIALIGAYDCDSDCQKCGEYMEPPDRIDHQGCLDSNPYDFLMTLSCEP